MQSPDDVPLLTVTELLGCVSGTKQKELFRNTESEVKQTPPQVARLNFQFRPILDALPGGAREP